MFRVLIFGGGGRGGIDFLVESLKIKYFVIVIKQNLLERQDLG